MSDVDDFFDQKPAASVDDFFNEPKDVVYDKQFGPPESPYNTLLKGPSDPAVEEVLNEAGVSYPDMEEVLTQATASDPKPEPYRTTPTDLVKDVIGSGKAAFRNVRQGLSMGLADELRAATRAPLKTIWEYGKQYLSDGGEPEGLIQSYKNYRDEERAADRTAEHQYPAASIIGSSIGGALIPGSSLKSMIAQGAIQGFGSSEEEDLGQLAKDTAMGAGVGTVVGALPIAMAGQRFEAGKSLTDAAEKFAENSTGATRNELKKIKQSQAMFKPSAAGEVGGGRELLDRKLIQFGDNPGDIAKRITSARQEASNQIGSVLKELDAQGGQVSIGDVTTKLQDRVNELEKIQGNEDLVKALNKEIDTLMTFEMNTPITSISEAELAKRAHQKRAKYNPNSETETSKQTATKYTAQAYREAGEEAAEKISPELTSQFKDAKRTYGMLEPIETAANNRAMTLAQSPFGGLLDLGAAGPGLAAAIHQGLSGNLGTAAASMAAAGGMAAGRKFGMPRAASSTAVASDKAGQLLLGGHPSTYPTSSAAYSTAKKYAAPIARASVSSMTDYTTDQNSPSQKNADTITTVVSTRPELLGKYAPSLVKAAERGPQALQVAHFVLMQKDQEYRMLIKDLTSNLQGIDQQLDSSENQ